MSNWLTVGHVNDIPVLGARIVKTADFDIAVFRTSNDEVFALKDVCPHRQGKLSQGIVHNNKVTCPLHNWNINLSDGQAIEPDVGCTHVFPARVEDGQIYIELNT